jgi:ubiquinone/menaquinone biosynthesis C-methylase UbiE
MVERIVADRPSRTLDWGCGLGYMSSLLTKAGLDVDSLEYDPAVEANGPVLKEPYPEIPIYLTSDPVKLPYGDNQFEAVLSCGVLEHVRDPDASLDEIHRVLVPGGILYVYKLANRWSYLEQVCRRIGWYYHGALPDDRMYTPRSARFLLERHGFAVSECRRANMLPLTLNGKVASALAMGIWHTSRAMSRVPGLNLVSTNVEAIAIAEA